MKWLMVFILMGCAQVTSLNLKKHQFGILPTKIIWFQVAGLEEEQIAMLRFQQPGNTSTSFEENICIGKTWNYNLYKLRNPSESAFLSQITGKKNIKNSCEDAEHRPIWNFINNNGYTTGIFERGADKNQSLTNFNKCGEKGLVFLTSLYLWLGTEPTPGAKTFHFTEDIPLELNQFVYDKTCTSKNCASTIQDNFNAIYGRLAKSSQKHLLIVRDFSYLKALEGKDMKKVREVLMDLERTYASALKLAADDSDYLVLLTTGDSRFVDMPDQGKSWFEFEKEGKNAQVKRTKLTNLVLASGARAENFCGMYGDSEIFERILSGPKQQGLELKIINPFK